MKRDFDGQPENRSGIGGAPPKQRPGLVVFLQSYSFLRVFLLTRWLRRAGRILFFAYPPIKSGRAAPKRKIILRWLRLLNPAVEIREVTMAEMVPDLYLLNKKGAEVADRLGPRVAQSVGYRLLLDVVRDENISLFYKAYLARTIPHPLLYAKMAQDFIREGGEVILSPEGVEDLGEGLAPEVKEEIHSHAPARVRFLERVERALRSLKWISVVLVLPALLFFRHLRNGRIRHPKPRGEAAIPVAWGVFKDSAAKMIGGVRRFNDEMYLYGQHFSPGEIVHVFGDWKFPPDMRKSCQEAMEEKGLLYTERDRFGVNGKLFRLTLETTAKVVRGLLRPGRVTPLDPLLWEAVAKGLYHFLLKRYEMENLDYKVELVKNDYNPGHVIATIVAHQHGRKRVGVSHAASPYDAPQMCFVHFEVAEQGEVIPFA